MISLDVTYSILSVIAVCAASAMLLKRYLGPASLPLPPGPQPLPIIGNITQIPSDAPLEKLKDWVDTYGPILTFKAGSRTAILLGDWATVRDLLEKRHSLYASRPRMIFLNEYLMRDLFVGTMQFGDKYRTMVRIRSPLFNPISVRAVSRLLPASTAYSLHEMSNGGDILDHIMLVFTRAFFALLYGTSLDDFGPSHVRDIKALLSLLGASFSPDYSMVDVFPALEYLPGFSWLLKRKAAAMLDPILSGTKARIERALRSPSWNAIQSIRAKSPPNMTLEEFSITFMELEAVPAAMSLTMCGIIRTSLLQPDAMIKLRAEMDHEIGPGRLPTQDDIPNLPFFNAFIQETIRLGSLTPLSLPRAPVHDDEYKGYRIPKDALVFAFQYGLNTDETVFKNPKMFDPSRWILNPNLPKPALFGFGKRACPGKAFVADTIALTMARMLWGYDFSFRRATPVQKFVDNLTFHIDSTEHIEYSCKSDAHQMLIDQAYRDAEVDPSAALMEIRGLF